MPTELGAPLTTNVFAFIVMVQNLNGYLMYFLWDAYISSKLQEPIMLLISERVGKAHLGL